MKKIFFLTEEGRYVFKENWYLKRIFIVSFFRLWRKFRKKSYIRNSCMSHEIRTPMNAIAGISEPALDFNLSYSEKKNRQIRSSGEELVGIVNDILYFSKIESGKLE